MVQHQSAAVGRKPLLLIAFGVLPVRGLLYTLTNSAPSLVAIQILDGIGAALSQSVAGGIVHRWGYHAGRDFKGRGES
jgi:predicted MFS family arabinose efflux permease